MIEQGTPEWFAQRLGKVTASRVADVIAKTKTGYSTSRENYMAQLVCERMTGTVAESYTNAAMQWGTDNEPLARAAYEAKMDVLVDEVAMITHPRIEQAGASPDGRQWCDFVSFDPRMPKELQLFIKRVQRDEDYISMLEKEVLSFLMELDVKVSKLNDLKENNG